VNAWGIDFPNQSGVRGPFHTRAEVADALREYQRTMGDHELKNVHIWEMQPYGSAGGEASAADFLNYE
jgi:hypothetical protein